MGNEIAGNKPAMRPSNPAPTNRAEPAKVVQAPEPATETPRRRARDAYVPAVAAPVVLSPAVAQLESSAPTYRVGALGGHMVPLSAPTAAADVEALRDDADDVLATEEVRHDATQQLGELAASGDAAAVGALRELTTLGREAAATELLGAPQVLLTSSDYRDIAHAAGESEEVRAALGARVASGEAAAIEGLSEAVLRADPNRDAFVGILAAAPPSTLTNEAYQALGSGAAGGNDAAFARLNDDARAGVEGAVDGLVALAKTGSSPGARDDGLVALAGAAPTSPASLEALRQANAEGWAERSDDVNAYLSATTRLTDPAQLSAELDAIEARGELPALIEQTDPALLARPELRSELMGAALGPPANEAVREALLYGLNKADAQLNSRIHSFAEADIAAVGSSVVNEIAQRAEHDPKMEELYSLIQVAQRTQTDAAFAREIDAERLESQLRATMEDPHVSAQLAEIRAASDVLSTADRLAERLEDPLYADRLRLMDTAAQQAALTEDLGQLAQLDPVRAGTTATRLAIASDPVAALTALTDDQRANAVETLAPELGLSPGTVSAWMNAVVNAKRLNLPVPGVDAWLNSVPEAERGRALKLLSMEADNLGHVATALTALGLADSIAAGDVRGAIRGGIDLAGSAKDVLQLAGVSNGFLLNMAKGMGAAAGAASAVLTAYDAGQEFHRGDMVGTVGTSLMAIGSGVAATAVFTGPQGAPVVLLVGFGFTATGAAVNMFSESDLESFARNQGLYRAG